VQHLSWPPPASAAGPPGSSSVCILLVNFTGRWVCYYEEEPFALVPFPFPEGFNANASPQSQTPRLGSTPPLSTRKHPTTAPRLNLRGGLRLRGAAWKQVQGLRCAGSQCDSIAWEGGYGSKTKLEWKRHSKNKKAPARMLLFLVRFTSNRCYATLLLSSTTRSVPAALTPLCASDERQ